MITIIRSRGLLYAQLKQTEKAKIDLEQTAIILRQHNNMATDEKVMQVLQKLGE
jgi:regulator of sirC expression with transglutaminase-like and TPR domain